MKRIKKVVFFIIVSALVTLSSCTNNSTVTDDPVNTPTTPTAKGNLVVWTNSGNDVGVLVKIKDSPLDSSGNPDLRRVNIVKTQEPNCGDVDCINFELAAGNYFVQDSRSTNETPVTIVSGVCTKMNLASVGGPTVGYGSVRFGTNNTTNPLYGQPIQITKNGVVIGLVYNTNVCSNCTSCNGSVGLDNLRADTGVGIVSGQMYKANISTRAENGHPSLSFTFDFGISIGQCSYVRMTY
jgi:hypothetical protein